MRGAEFRELRNDLADRLVKRTARSTTVSRRWTTSGESWPRSFETRNPVARNSGPILRNTVLVVFPIWESQTHRDHPKTTAFPAAAARRLHASHPKISALRNYQLQGFSVERLMKFLTPLDRDVEVVIRHKSRTGKGGRVLVTAA